MDSSRGVDKRQDLGNRTEPCLITASFVGTNRGNGIFRRQTRETKPREGKKWVPRAAKCIRFSRNDPLRASSWLAVRGVGMPAGQTKPLCPPPKRSFRPSHWTQKLPRSIRPLVGTWEPIRYRRWMNSWETWTRRCVLRAKRCHEICRRESRRNQSQIGTRPYIVHSHAWAPSRIHVYS